MTIDKSRRTFFAFAMFAISSVALLTPSQAAVAKPTIRPAAHTIYWTPQVRTPAPQYNRPASDPFASMLFE
jgi:hypothetical protein